MLSAREREAPTATLPAVDSNGLLFMLPITGGTTITPVGTVRNTFDLVPVPPKSPTTGYFADIGTPGLNSEVDLFNASTGADVPILTGIPARAPRWPSPARIRATTRCMSASASATSRGRSRRSMSKPCFRASKAARRFPAVPARSSIRPTETTADRESSSICAATSSPAGRTAVEVIVGSGNAPYNYSIPYTADGGGLLSYVSVSYNAITNQFTTEGYDMTGSFPVPETNVYSASQFGVAQGNLLNWTGTNMDGTTTNNSWDTSGNSSNWAANVPSGNSNFTASTYSDGDTVTFGDANPISPSGALVPNVNGKVLVNIAAGGVQPAAVMFTNSGAANGGVDYTITGGPIGGAATIELYGNGAVGGIVTLTSPNTFTGPVVVAAGVLNLQDAAALGNSSGVSVIAGACARIAAVDRRTADIRLDRQRRELDSAESLWHRPDRQRRRVEQRRRKQHLRRRDQRRQRRWPDCFLVDRQRRPTHAQRRRNHFPRARRSPSPDSARRRLPAPACRSAIPAQSWSIPERCNSTSARAPP